MAGFEVTFNGRFWVTPEVRELKPDGAPALELVGRSDRNYLNYGNLISGFAL
jgi:hypothetical protein